MGKIKNWENTTNAYLNKDEKEWTNSEIKSKIQLSPFKYSTSYEKLPIGTRWVVYGTSNVYEGKPFRSKAKAIEHIMKYMRSHPRG